MQIHVHVHVYIQAAFQCSSIILGSYKNIYLANQAYKNGTVYKVVLYSHKLGKEKAEECNSILHLASHYGILFHVLLFSFLSMKKTSKSKTNYLVMLVFDENFSKNSQVYFPLKQCSPTYESFKSSLFKSCIFFSPNAKL